MSSGLFHVASFAFTLSTRSSSTQPPDTEPTIWPSSRTATIAPTGRGAEPQVLTMVPSATLWPSLRHFSARAQDFDIDAIHAEMLSQPGTLQRANR